MFVIILTYKKPIEEIDKYLIEHREFLDKSYKDNFFVVSGPKNPRTGGVIISQLQDRNQLEDILKQDPFNIHDLANYEIMEFSPVKYHVDFSSFVGASIN